MAEDPKLVKLRGSNSRYKQHVINLERAVRKLTKDYKRMIKEVKRLKEENSKLNRRLREAVKVNKKK